MGEGSANHTNPYHTPTIIQPSISQPQMKQDQERTTRKDLRDLSIVFNDNVAVVDDPIDQRQHPNEPSYQETSSGGGPRRQETMGDTIAQTRLRMYLTFLMIHCSQESTRYTQANEIESLKRRVKKLERRNRSRTHRLKRLYKVDLTARVESSKDEGLGKEDASKQERIADIDADAGINLVSTHFDADTDMFGVHDLVGDEVVVESEVVVNADEIRSVVGENISVAAITVSAASEIPTVTTVDELTLAQALAELKSARPPTQRISFREPNACGEKEKPMKKQEQMRIDEELAFKLQAEEEEEEERLAREKAQQN
ncbi:hypothetical protein Tco_0044791 [Tanacetum coccineum]